MTPAAPVSPPRRRHWLVQAALTATSMFVFAWLCGVAMRADAKLTTPPGFFRGMVHGAMMPVAWPSLLAGHDQPIYAEINEGRTYKLGYSMGVNLSGVIFFGWLFLGLSTLRKAWAAKSAAKRGADLTP